MTAPRWALWLLLAASLPAIAVCGYTIPRRLISDGVDRFASDPAAHATAASAYNSVWMLNDNPWGRLALPGARVHRVWRAPGHCRDPRPDGAQGEYRATVRTFTWFAIPGPVVHAQCGGWYATWGVW